MEKISIDIIECIDVIKSTLDTRFNGEVKLLITTDRTSGPETLDIIEKHRNYHILEDADSNLFTLLSFVNDTIKDIFPGQSTHAVLQPGYYTYEEIMDRCACEHEKSPLDPEVLLNRMAITRMTQAIEGRPTI